MNTDKALKVLVSLHYARITNTTRDQANLEKQAKEALSEITNLSQKEELDLIFDERDYEGRLRYFFGPKYPPANSH